VATRKRSKKKSKQSVKSEILNEYEKTNAKVDIDSLNLWANNPNNDYSTVDRLAELLKVHGQVTEVVVWPKNMVIYKGNHTWKALKKLGAKKIDVLFVDFPNEGAAIAYGMADNASGRWGNDMDPDLLAKMLKSKEVYNFAGGEEEIRMAAGFNEKEFKALMLSTDEMPTSLPNVDIAGIAPGKNDFMVVQFDSKDQMNKFKKILGIDVEHQRVIPIEKLERIFCSVSCKNREVRDFVKEGKVKKTKKTKKTKRRVK
jgi:hypothetical protein